MSESPLLTSSSISNDDSKGKKSKADADVNSVVFVLVSNFTLAIQYSLLMPTVWKYLSSMGSTKIMLGFVLASFTTAQCVFMPMLGKLGDKFGVKRVYPFCYAAAMIGCFMYGIAGKVDSAWMCLAARFVSGIGASANVLNTACVTKWSAPKELNKNMNLYLAVRMIGNIIGPVFMILLAKVNFTLLDFIIVKDTTSPGYIMIIPNLILLIMSLTMFTEPDMTNVVGGNNENINTDITPKIEENEKIEKTLFHKILIERGAWFPLLLQFTGCFNIGMVETALTPITHGMFGDVTFSHSSNTLSHPPTHTHTDLGWSTGKNSILFIMVSVVIFCAIAFSIMVKKCDGDTAEAQRNRPRRLVLIGQIASFFGIVFIFSYELFVGKIKNYALYLFTLTGGFPIPLLIAPPNAIYAAKLEMGSKGHFMAYVGISQSLGRTLGPLVGSGAVSVTSTHFWPIGVVCLTTWTIGSISMVWLWDKMKIDAIDDTKRTVLDDDEERGASFSGFVTCEDDE